eukprot:TRINITY_DN1772_c4_g1_i1.p1 TRINITY_DN1772_c4_g1~~TRINITY_DN1772_c4_g1_i1.p1  ORF type:complete len:355 (+),score=67.33 TRINITY_DN1772_c4_g1_i1:58-1122(+)
MLSPAAVSLLTLSLFSYPISSEAATAKLNTIDFGGFKNSNAHDRRELLDILDKSLKEHHMVALSNVGVNELISQAREQAKDFFSTSTENKQKYYQGGVGSQGYVPSGYEKISRSEDMNPDSEKSSPDAPADALESLNYFIFDRALPTDVGPDGQLRETSKLLVTRLMDVFSGFHEMVGECLQTDFTSVMNNGLFQLRYASYYGMSEQKAADIIEKGGLRCGSHTDYLSFTLLALDGVPGLQLFVNDSWHDVEVDSDAEIVVNSADLNAHWTNGRWPASRHRVALTSHLPRMSIVFFSGPNLESEIRVLDCKKCDSTNPKYPPIIASEHLKNRMEPTKKPEHESDDEVWKKTEEL